MAPIYLEFWPSAVAAVCLAGLSATRLSARSRTWLVTATVVTSLALALYVPPLLERAADPLHNMLGRDIVASVALAVGVPAFGAWIALLARDISPVRRAISALAASLLLLAASPLVLLIAHCTSGDCL